MVHREPLLFSSYTNSYWSFVFRQKKSQINAEKEIKILKS